MAKEAKELEKVVGKLIETRLADFQTEITKENEKRIENLTKKMQKSVAHAHKSRGHLEEIWIGCRN